MPADISKAPYNDDYNPNKKYTQILAVPGRVEQAREFTQMQSMFYDYLKRLSDTLLKNGAIVSGMGFTLKSSSILVESGRVYLNGKIHMFDKQEVPITKKGIEVVGVKLDESIITEVQDGSLLDPVTSTGNFGQPGAHRIKSTVTLAVNDVNASTIYEFVDGGLKSEIPRPQFDGLADLLARRTYDQSGNYRVNGLEIHVEPYDANNVKATVEVGTAYIKGYQVIKPTPVKNLVPISKNTRSVIGEPKVYTTGTNQYKLNNLPAKTISKVTGYVQVSQPVTKGSLPTGIDPLSKTPVVNIISVTAGATTYVKGKDYQLTSDGVDWSLSGAKPTSGSSYTVVYQYNKTMVQGTDYQMFSEIGKFGETTDYIKFLAGDKPDANSTFYIDYDFYLARIDLVSIDKDGNIIITTGQSDIPRNVQPPIINTDDMLPLGSLYMPPNSGGAQATFNSITRLDMAELQRMSKRVTDIEYNQAITALDREAMDGELPTDLRGIFSDSFRSTVRADLAHANFNIMYDLEFGTVMNPISKTTTATPVISNTGAVKQWGRLFTAPMTEVLSIQQQYSTTSMLVNPYLAFNAMGTMALTPAVDNWIDEAYILVEKTEFKARNFWRWWGHPERKAWVEDLFDFTIEGGISNGQKVGDWRPEWQANVFPSATAVKTEKSRSVLEEAVTYMRPITVEIYAQNLVPSTDNLQCTFDGIRVTLTPVSGFSAGTSAGTVRANTSGEVKAQFTIPANSVRTGTREVILSNSTNSANAAFTAIGTKRTTTDTILTTRVTLTAIDPLAQTFQFENDTVLTSVGAYFSGKDTTHNVVVQIRNVVNGYPGNVIYGEKVLTPSQVLVSGNATTETKVTFSDPIVCSANTQYCVVYLTDSDKHSLYVCDLGGTDITTGVKVLRQPYLAGMLFSSSNGIAWTAHQSMNMKFNIYTAKFNASTTVDFTELTSLDADRLVLMADSLVPAGTNCVWQVSLDGGAYIPINPYGDLDLLKIASKAKLRATLTTTGTMSPIIALDSMRLIAFATATSGSYIGRNVELVDKFTNVKQIYDAYIPSGCTVTPQFSYDNGVTWLTPTQVSASPLSPEWTRYMCEMTVAPTANAKKFRARLNITSNDRTLRPRARRFANVMK